MDTVDKLWALEQIKCLKSRYYRLQDQNRWDDWAKLFTDDCEIIDPNNGNVLYGPKAIADRTAQLTKGSQRAHRGTMPDLEIIDETHARGTWALCTSAQYDLGDGLGANHHYGYYTDEYRKDADGEWRIHRMRFDNDMVIFVGGVPREINMPTPTFQESVSAG